MRFLLWLIYWFKGRRERKQLLEQPYFWGPPDDHKAWVRYEAYKRAIGYPDANRS